MELAIHNISGKKTTKKAKLADAVFAMEPNDHAIYLDVKGYLANQRQGTHKTKARAEITGSTRKIKKQKGTGTARAGSIKNPIFRGGGRAFGPEPRNYGIKLNKKVSKLARTSALSYKAKEKGLMIVEDFTFDAPKTTQYIDLLNNLEVNDGKTLMVLNEANKNVYLSSRNIQGTKVVTAAELCTYDILNAKSVIISVSSVETIENTLS